MNRNFLLTLILFIVAFIVVVVLITAFATRVSESTLVVCKTPIATYGGTVVSVDNETFTTITSGYFFPQGTITSTFITNVTFSATPGYSTSISELGNCTFTSAT